jgi:hypothetical protein
MTTENILNQLGLTEDQFYALYPTEDSFKKANPDLYKMLKGGVKPKPQYTGQPTESEFYNFGGLPQGPIGFYKSGGQPCFECGGSKMQAGGDTLKYREQFYPNTPVMMGTDTMYRTSPSGEMLPIYKDYFSKQETFDPRAKRLMPIQDQSLSPMGNPEGSPVYRKVGPGFFQDGGTQGFTSENFQQRPINNLLKFTNAAAQKAMLKEELENAFNTMNPSMMFQGGGESNMMGPENFNYDMFLAGANPTMMPTVPITGSGYGNISDEDRMLMRMNKQNQTTQVPNPGLSPYMGDIALMNLDFYTNLFNADERNNFKNYKNAQSSAENSFNSFGKGSRGDYYSNMSAGTHFRPDQMNPMTRRDSYQVGGEYEMTDEEIQQFLAMGGTIEYID